MKLRKKPESGRATTFAVGRAVPQVSAWRKVERPPALHPLITTSVALPKPLAIKAGTMAFKIRLPR